MASLVEILRDGYFPKELPNTFVTGSFASVVCSNSSSLPQDYRRVLPYKKTTLPIKYSYCQSGKLHRCLSVLNPVPFYLLATEVSNNWNQLKTAASISPISVTIPSSAPLDGRAIASQSSWSELPSIRINKHLGNRYLLKADVSRYYHSVYTHSISWALHTKPVAKITQNNTLLGNRIDTYIRKCQDGQTMGIPVGTDISFLIGEIILSKVDETLASRISNLKGFRWIDDYELSFETLAEAENCLHHLQSILSEYELSLNQVKTNITSLPVDVSDRWSYELKRFSFDSGPRKQANDLIGFFNLAIDLSKQHPGKAVLKYAISRLRYLQVHSANADLLQRLLLFCISHEQGTLRFVIEQLIRLKLNGVTMASNLIRDSFNSHIRYHGPLENTSEIAWAVYGALALNISLDDSSANILSQVDNSIIALLSLDAESRGLFGIRLNSQLWKSNMTSSGLYRENWLLSYEANVKGWLPSLNTPDHVSSDPNFGFLKNAGVEFYKCDNIGTIGITPSIPTEDEDLSLVR